jgi:hypothetical protein
MVKREAHQQAGRLIFERDSEFCPYGRIHMEAAGSLPIELRQGD